jgi:hypothetical protein
MNQKLNILDNSEQEVLDIQDPLLRAAKMVGNAVQHARTEPPIIPQHKSLVDIASSISNAMVIHKYKIQNINVIRNDCPMLPRLDLSQE